MNPASRNDTRAILFALVMAETTAGFETTLVLTALAKMIVVFGDPIGVGWLVSAYLLISTAAAAIAARFGDLYDRRLMLLITMALAVVGSIVSAAAPSLPWVIAGRCIQGFAGALLPLCFGLARERLPADQVARGIGVVAATASLTSGLGLILGGVIVDLLSWRFIFLTSAAVGVLAIISVLLFLPPAPGKSAMSKPRELDFVGGLLFAPAIAALLLAISKGSQWGWFSTPVLALALGGLATLVVWALHEARHPNPLIDVKLLRNPQIGGVNLCFLLVGLGALQPQFVLLLLQQPAWTGVGLGVSATIAGFVKAPAQFVGALSSFASGSFGDRVGAANLLALGVGAILLGWTWMALFHNDTWSIFASYTIIGVGVGTVMTSAPLIIIGAAPPHRTSEATGLASVSRTLGTSIGAQILAVVLASSRVAAPGGEAAPHPSADAYMLGFAYVVAASALAFGLALNLRRRRDSAHHTTQSAQTRSL